ncbi:MAG: hypothetical protein LBI53_00345 [Candidatus Peribacteria bacterium]|jgi:hypothetical protein|nr:hypothetical protein [Candidatus Peribacteria bacterium]
MIESNKRLEEEKKKKKQEQIDREDYEQALTESKVKIEIQELKYLIETGVVTTEKDLVEKIVANEQISHTEFNQILENIDIQKLFEKLEEIENTQDMDEIIPKPLRVTKDEYLQAFQDQDIRTTVLQKFNQALDNICNAMHGGQTMHGNLFATYTYMLNLKLIPIQEDIIDLKQPLLENETLYYDNQ